MDFSEKKHSRRKTDFRVSGLANNKICQFGSQFEQKSHNYLCIAPTQGTVFNDNLLIGKLNRSFVEWFVIRPQYSLCLLCNCDLCNCLQYLQVAFLHQ